MMARSTTLQPKAEYIDARPFTTNSTKFSCYARPDHTFGSRTTAPACDTMSATTPVALELADLMACGIRGLAIASLDASMPAIVADVHVAAVYLVAVTA